MSVEHNINEVESSDVYHWYKFKVDGMMNELDLDCEDLSISQMMYLKGQITNVIDVLLLTVKHADLMINDLKNQKENENKQDM